MKKILYLILILLLIASNAYGATSYKTGDRTSEITITCSSRLGSILVGGSVFTALINGNTADNAGWFQTQGVTSGEWVKFDFLTNPKIVDEVTYYQGSQTLGTWQWEGSNDDINWTTIGSSFTFGNNETTQVQTSLNGNTNAYRWYRLHGISGNMVDNWIREFQFKDEDGVVPPTEFVPVGMYGYVAELGTGNFGRNTAGTFNAIFIGNKTRIRQDGSLAKVNIYTAVLTNTTEFCITVWRKDGLTYDRIGISENIIASLTGSTAQSVEFATPIANVQEGDFLGVKLVSTGVGYALFANTSVVGVDSYYIGDDVATSNYDWEAQTNINEAFVKIIPYMIPPYFVGIGDSLMCGCNGHSAYTTTTDNNNPAYTILYQLDALMTKTYQNMGIGSETSTLIEARFNADVVVYYPTYAIILCGVNDIAGAGSKATYLAKMTSMLNKCVANNIIPIVVKILAWTNGTNEQMQSRDDWNADLATLVGTYPTAKIVDTSSRIGEFRVGGDAGNLWDIQAIYDDDGVHLNQAGYGKVAEAIQATFTQIAKVCGVNQSAISKIGSIAIGNVKSVAGVE